MADFRIAYNLVREHEGGYVNNPKDRGGETYKGIARKFFPSWSGWKIIDSYRSERAFLGKLDADADLQAAVLAFYKANFWNPLSLDQAVNQSIANELFDTGANMGLDTAGRFLQRSLNVLNRQGKTYPDVFVDGKIGASTIKVLNAHPSPATVLKVLNVLQGAKYVAICEANPSQEVFMNGWLNRVALY